ncbi:hypothetical protein SI65_04180 [Aspergillus cristatus]|uniref:Uncharacterized protein n=1 Tax=Aspergillus cristatus TaxID=573508 RepID=A0A1E3BJP8_ASPCR|nr:hypothetical protein SI65_04180 [Aspergillus cristatus]
MQKDGHYMIRILVNQKNINFNAADNYGRTPLSYVVSNGNIFSLVMLLWCHDIDVNLPDVNGETPLHFTVYSAGAHWAVERLLKDSRTLPNKQSTNGFPLSIVAFRGDMRLLNIFMTADRSDIDFDCRSDAFPPPLQNALLCMHERFAIRLLQAPGLNLNSIFYYQMTPLMLGLHLKGSDFMRYLLRYPGIEFNHEDMVGRTAVMIAAQVKNIDGLKMLLVKEEVDMNHWCALGKTVLDYARSSDDPEVISVIKACGRFKDL